MWKPFTTSKEAYLLKFNHIDNTYVLHLTDLRKLWTSAFSENIMIEKFQECNPMLDIKSEEVISQVKNMFDKVDQFYVEVIPNESMMNLSIKSNISEFKIKYEITLAETEDEKFMDNVTIPLIQTVHFLEIQQKMLCNLIEKKDRELEEYQMEKGAISRSDLVTEKFDSSMLVSSSQRLILNTLGSSQKFVDHIKNKYGETTEKVVEVEVEVWNKGKRKRKIYNQSTAAKPTQIVYKG